MIIIGVKEIIDNIFRNEGNIDRTLYDPDDVNLKDDVSNLRLNFDIMRESPNGDGILFDKCADGAGHYRDCPWYVIEVKASDIQKAKTQIKSTLNHIYNSLKGFRC